MGRLHIANLLKRTRAAQLRMHAPITAALLRPLPPLFSDSVNDHGFFALVVLTSTGQISWYRAQYDVALPMESMGIILETSGASVAFPFQGNGTDLLTLAIGDQTGDVTLWQFQAAGGTSASYQRSWHFLLRLRPAHHDWESVINVAVSEDGSLLLACTSDGVILWRINSLLNGDHAADELRHVHGGQFQAASVAVAASPASKLSVTHVVALAFVSGALEGWAVHAPGTNTPRLLTLNDVQRGSPMLSSSADVTDLWHFPPLASAPRLLKIAVLPGCCMSAGADDGTVSLWALDTGGHIEKNPIWTRSVAKGYARAPVTSLAINPSGTEVAAGIGSQAVVVDVRTGYERNIVAHGGEPLSFAWL